MGSFVNFFLNRAHVALLCAGFLAAIPCTPSAKAQSDGGLDRLLQSPLDRQAIEHRGWSHNGDTFDRDVLRQFTVPDVIRGAEPTYGSSYGTYYRFGARMPGFYNDHDHRFWTNSYGGPWYYPGSPANTRSGWMDWTPRNP